MCFMMMTGMNFILVLLVFATVSADDNETCVLDGKDGNCVAYYQCSPDTNTLITDGMGIIDVRFGERACSSFLEVCCFPNDVIEDPKVAREQFLNALEVEPQVALASQAIDAQLAAFTPAASCGTSNPRGVGASISGHTDGEAQFGEFPWTAVLLTTSTKKLVGGGSIIHPNVVLTAAHKALKWQDLTVRAGEWDLKSTNEMLPHQDRTVSEVLTHPRFNRANYQNDVALLILNEPLEMSAHISPVCLPLPLQVYQSRNCVTSGWGKNNATTKKYPNLMKKIEVPLVEHGQCQQRLRTTRLGAFFILDKSLICAGGEVGKDACRGDGGGPLICPTADNKYVQAGIVAAGIGCGGTNPSLYVNIEEFKPWIDQKMVEKGYGTTTYTAATSETQS